MNLSLIGSRQKHTYSIHHAVVCGGCGEKASKLYQYNDINYCGLCGVIVQYNELNAWQGVFCSSELSQQTIIVLTSQYIVKNKKIPLIRTIDPSAQFVSASCLDLLETFKNATPKELKQFDDIKMFFTDKIDVSFFPCGFNSKIKRMKDFDFFVLNDLETKKISGEQKKIIECYHK